MPYEHRRRLAAAVLPVIVAVEDVAQAALVGLFGMLGRREIAVLPFIGYGTPERVRLRGRVVLGRSPDQPAATDLIDDAAGGRRQPRSRWVPWRERWATLRAHLSSVSPGISGDPSKVKPVTGREIDPPPLRDRPCSCDGDGWLWTVELWPVGRTDELRAVDVPTPCPGTVHRRAS